jgi:hypothetical protein
VRVKLVFAGGLAITAGAVIAMLGHSPTTVAATNGVPRSTVIGGTEASTGACQTGETLPRGTTALRLGMTVTIGPRVAVRALMGSHLIAYGVRGAGWNGGAVVVPITEVDRTYSNVTICFELSRLTGSISLIGAQTNPALAATDGSETLSGRMTIEDMRPGEDSWWSLAGAVIRHMGLGRTPSVPWIALPIAALMASAIALASWVTIRELR